MTCCFKVYGVLFLFFWTLTSFAQVTATGVSGTIKDSQGAVLSGATVVVLSEETGVSRTVETDSSGRYRVVSLSPGPYRLRASHDGFQTVVRTGIVLPVGRAALVNFELPAGSSSQTVELSGSPLSVQSADSTVGSAVDGTVLRDLPLAARSYDALVLVQPGVVQYGAGAGVSFEFGTGSRFSTAGGRGYTNSFLLDGTGINDHANGTPGNSIGRNPGVEAIREFSVLTHSYQAEYGGASGAIVSSVTRSGTNQFHGSLFAFHNNSALTARDYFTARFGLGDVPPSRVTQFGATFGGPIRRGKTFFFGNYEGWREGLTITQFVVVPDRNAKQGILPGSCVAGCGVAPTVRPFLLLYPDPNGPSRLDGTASFISNPTIATDGDYFLVRGDHQLRNNMSLFGRYLFDDDSRVTPRFIPAFEDRLDARRQYSTLQVSNVLRPALLNAFRFAYNRSAQASDSLPTTKLGPEFSFVPGLPMGSIAVSGLSALGTSTTAPRWWVFNSFQWGDDLTYVRGNHKLKFGATGNRIRDNTAEHFFPRGQYLFASLEGFIAARPTTFIVVAPGKDASRGFRQSVFALYAQDDWRLASRLTVNLGLRWEAATNPTEAHGRISNIQTPLDSAFKPVDEYFQVSKKNFEPRVGLAWQLRGSGKTVLRAGAGVYHDHLLPFVYARYASKLPPFYGVLDVFSRDIQLAFPNSYQQVVALRPLTFVSNITTMAWENRTPTKYHFSLAFQQQLWKNAVLEVAYIGSTANHLWRRAERNTPVPTVSSDGRKFFPLGTPRRNVNFSSVQLVETDANSSYHAVQLSARRATASGLQFQASYTFSKSLDDITSFATGDTVNEAPSSLDPDDRSRDRGLSAFHAKNHFAFYASYPFPFRFQDKVLSLILGGWKINAIGTFISGRPFTARLTSNQSRNGDPNVPDRPDLVPGRSNNPVIGGDHDRSFDPLSFAFPQPGTYGTLGRNTLIGPGFANLDLSVEKTFPVWENLTVQFRAESFNVTNRVNFGLPSATVFTSSGSRSAAAGRINSVITAPRQIQFGLRIAF